MYFTIPDSCLEETQKTARLGKGIFIGDGTKMILVKRIDTRVIITAIKLDYL